MYVVHRDAAMIHAPRLTRHLVISWEGFFDRRATGFSRVRKAGRERRWIQTECSESKEAEWRDTSLESEPPPQNPSEGQ